MDDSNLSDQISSIQPSPFTAYELFLEAFEGRDIKEVEQHMLLFETETHWFRWDIAFGGDEAQIFFQHRRQDEDPTELCYGFDRCAASLIVAKGVENRLIHLMENPGDGAVIDFTPGHKEPPRKTPVLRLTLPEA